MSQNYQDLHTPDDTNTYAENEFVFSDNVIKPSEIYTQSTARK